MMAAAHIRRELNRLDLREIATALRTGQTSAAALMELTLDRAKALNPRLNAIVSLWEERALDDARKADKERALGFFRGPLHGVPLAHKDMFYRAGVPCSVGLSVPFAIPTDTAAVLERLDSAGAIQFGALNLAELAYGPTGHNYHLGHCRNPWNTDYISGGSSSGSAVAVAARLSFAALGSDTAGSIRLPAAACGVTGLKVTQGRISRTGSIPGSFSMDTVGIIARSAADCAMLLDILAEPKAGGRIPSGNLAGDHVGVSNRKPPVLRIGVPKLSSDDVSPEIGLAIEEALNMLGELGCKVVPVVLPDLTRYDVAGFQVMASEISATYRTQLTQSPHTFSDQMQARLQRGLVIPATTYIDALRFRGVALREFRSQVFGSVDVLVLPCLTLPTPTIAETDIGGRPDIDQMISRLVTYLRPISFLGLPSLSIPIGFQAIGLPIGMQLVGRPYDEATLLSVGEAFQFQTDWHRRVPPLC
ncbi:amidase [Bradyrhizobium prioriisuperbiae]|uniref:amidase n=1 Tax=Bradyrhizobium prioriisuperbiae TaxID=2854389 RepID=UPI0028E2F8A7|nr:amidase [Bradyrhizobium prioritasuperba]